MSEKEITIMPDIAFMTYVHNGEKSMRKSIESVLSQKDVNLVYYLIDNASTDSTWNIMCEYAAKDSRVRLLQNENSLVAIPDYIKGIKDCEYFAVLDADDWYEPEFAKETIAFIKQENLDIAAVGVKYNAWQGDDFYVDVDKPIIIKHAEICDNHELWSRFLRTMWGNVFSLSLVQNMDFSEFNLIARKNIFYGIDTVFCLSAMRSAGTIGILDKVLHQYRMDPASDTYQFNLERIYMLRVWMEIWLDIFGRYDEQGRMEAESVLRVSIIYTNEMLQMLELMVQSKMDTKSFLRGIKHMAEFPVTGIIMGVNCKEIKDYTVITMIRKVLEAEQDQETVGLLYECLKQIDAVDLFQSYMKEYIVG